MSTFESNIAGIYGERRIQWLQQLPGLVNTIARSLGLSKLTPVTNLSYNYVASGFQNGTPVILKVGLDFAALGKEALTLQYLKDHGVVKVLAAGDGFLLLEQAIPGNSLKAYFPGNDIESIRIAVNVMQHLHLASIPASHSFPHIQDWLSVLDNDQNIPHHYLEKARRLRNKLLQNLGKDVLLHGDLHHDNILQHSTNWLAIDPKGVIGEKCYEVAAFIRNPMPHLIQQANVQEIIQKRISCFAAMLEIPQNRILSWCFVQAVLAWSWALEDKCPTQYYEQITKIFDYMGKTIN